MSLVGVKTILRRTAADLLTSSPARVVAMVVDVLVIAAAYFAARLRGRQVEDT
jgi:hypothetical protein